MKFIKLFLMLLLVVLLTACATMPYPKMNGQASRKDFSGFSLSTPIGDNWYVMQENSQGIVYAKYLKSKINTFYLAVQVANLTPTWKDQAEFVIFVKEAKRADTDPKRFKILEEEYVLNEKFGKYGVKYHMKVEDHNAYSSGGSLYLILEVDGYGIMHPSGNGTYYDVNYSARYKPGEEDPSLKETGEIFINSFQLKQ